LQQINKKSNNFHIQKKNNFAVTSVHFRYIFNIFGYFFNVFNLAETNNLEDEKDDTENGDSVDRADTPRKICSKTFITEKKIKWNN